MTKRLFIAIKINPDKKFIDEFRNLRNVLSHEKIKWVEEYNIHITLKFFGETDEARIEGIKKIMNEVSLMTDAFPISLKGIGIFGSKYDPRIIWIGIEPYHFVSNLMKHLHEKLKSIGFEPDRQNLVPHLTIGRIRSIADKGKFQRILDNYINISSAEMTADSMILYESILKKEGPVYVPLATSLFRRT